VSGPFRFEVVPGVGHFVTDQAPEAVTRLLLSHLGGQAQAHFGRQAHFRGQE